MIPDEVRIARAVLDSHLDRVGSDLVERTGDAAEDAQRLRTLDSVVLCHDGGADPVFVYANEAAARQWGTTVERLIGMPSRLTAGPDQQADRTAALARAMATGVVLDYSGERRGLDGSRFLIEEAVLWRVDALPGQAAAFSRTAPASSERLAYRSWRTTDAAWVLDAYARPEVYRFLGAQPRPVADIDEAQQRIAAWRDRAVGPFGVWAILVDGGPVGSVLLQPLPRTDGAPTDAVEIGWHLHPDAWGNGYATEAARAVIARARSGGMSRVHAVTYPDNTRSRAVCRRLGMTETGLTCEWYGVEVVDHVLEIDPLPTSPATA